MRTADAIGFRVTNLLVYAVLENGPARFKDISYTTKIGPMTISKILQQGLESKLIKEQLVPWPSRKNSAKGYALDAKGKELLRFLRMLNVDVDGLVLELKRNA